MRRLSAKQLAEYLAHCETAPLLLDVREPWEYQQCHIEGSQLIPMREVPQAISELDPAREIVVICHHGIRSRQIAYYLEREGFTNLINLEGGVEAWAQDVDQTMKRY